ncbi:hypothetical protein K491DRAFT_710593 [Lophiostoma macrostomum CBS 122681]|uniref:Uncharacterized protein n=1 Tax=Lophiostoma macrostomum CBS 122681 TaxID=1314788 RepID=A0A6A6TRH9_9PLEO|nr:hypothetical protein K491DRAFT_710593 [Lophiostoma macrostomum CBS 122681]
MEQMAALGLSNVQRLVQVASVPQAVDLKAQQPVAVFPAAPPVSLPPPATVPPPAVTAPPAPVFVAPPVTAPPPPVFVAPPVTAPPLPVVTAPAAAPVFTAPAAAPVFTAPAAAPVFTASAGRTASRFSNRHSMQKHHGNTTRPQGGSAQVPVSTPIKVVQQKPTPAAAPVQTVVFDTIDWKTADLATLATAHGAGKMQLGNLADRTALRHASYVTDLDLKQLDEDDEFKRFCRDQPFVEDRLGGLAHHIKKATFVLRLQVLQAGGKNKNTKLCTEMHTLMMGIMDMLQILAGNEPNQVQEGDWASFADVMRYLYSEVCVKWKDSMDDQYGKAVADSMMLRAKSIASRFL